MNHLLILDCDADEYVTEISGCKPADLVLYPAGTPEEARPFMSEANIILGRPALVSELLPAAERLSWVQSTFAGVEALCIPGLRYDYTLTGVKNTFGPLMSEYVFAYLLAIERNLFETRQHQLQKDWRKMPYRSLSGVTIGIAGLGSIGRHIAQTAAQFGMRILGLKRSHGEVDHVDKVFTPAQIGDFLPELDYLVLTLPDTPESRHFINQDGLRRMKRSAILINVGRGAAVDETALADALRKGLIKGAVLDVFGQEPLPQSSPLWTMPNVFISPHNAALSFPRQIVGIFLENYQRFLENKTLRYVVDFKRGY